MKLAAIQDIYPNPPVLRYHRLVPKIEREFGQTTTRPLRSVVNSEAETRTKINWLDITVAFFLGYLIGGRRHE